MGKLVLLHVEDDAQLLERLIDYAQPDDFEILNAATLEDAKAIVDSVAQIDCAIIDMMLPRDERSRNGDEADVKEYGPELVRLVRRRFRDAFIVGVSKRAELSRADHSFLDRFIVKKDEPRYLRSLSQIIAARYGKQLTFSLNCFIVHGHDHAAVKDLQSWLGLNTRFERAIILADEPAASVSLIEKFESSAAVSDAVFVLLTRDDRAVSQAELTSTSAEPSAPTPSAKLRYRARQNVIFEAGYFLGRFGREYGRVFLLYQGDLELPTDMAGMVFIDISQGIAAAHEDLIRELKGFAC